MDVESKAETMKGVGSFKDDGETGVQLVWSS